MSISILLEGSIKNTCNKISTIESYAPFSPVHLWKAAFNFMWYFFKSTCDHYICFNKNHIKKYFLNDVKYNLHREVNCKLIKDYKIASIPHVFSFKYMNIIQYYQNSIVKMMSAKCLQQVIFLIVIKHSLSWNEFSQINSESSGYQYLSQLEIHIHHLLVRRND